MAVAGDYHVGVGGGRRGRESSSKNQARIKNQASIKTQDSSKNQGRIKQDQGRRLFVELIWRMDMLPFYIVIDWQRRAEFSSSSTVCIRCWFLLPYLCLGDKSFSQE
jgi:hypothetical protein